MNMGMCQRRSRIVLWAPDSPPGRGSPARQAGRRPGSPPRATANRPPVLLRAPAPPLSQQVIDLVREYNALGRSTLAIMLDTKGPEVRSGDLTQPLHLAPGEHVTFTITAGADGSGNRIGVNYDGFIDDVEVGDMLLVDGGIMSMLVKAKTDTDVLCEVVDGGAMKSRRHLNIRGKSANLPAITDRDWADIRFGLEQGVDYFALSFVRTADIVYELKEWLAKQGGCMGGKAGRTRFFSFIGRDWMRCQPRSCLPR